MTVLIILALGIATYWFFNIFMPRINKLEINQKILIAKIKTLESLKLNSKESTNFELKSPKNKHLNHQKHLKNSQHSSLTTPKLIKNLTKNLEKSLEDAPTWFKNIHWEDFLGRKLLGALGAISIVFAIGFFMKWAFSNGLIGPHGRLFIGFLISAIFIIAGEFMRPKYPLFFDKFVGIGIAGILVTTFLGRTYIFEGLTEPIISATHAFMGYVFAVTIGLFLSLRYNSRFLGNFTTLAGLISPFLSIDIAPIPLLIYLSILIASSFILALKKQWPEIWGLLFIGILPLESQILDSQTIRFNNQQVWQDISPTIYLCFIFGIHYFLASGGIIRSLLRLEKNKIANLKNHENTDSSKNNLINLTKTEIFESLLLIAAIIIVNGLGQAVFEMMKWENFGFFVLAQGFLLFGLAEVFKKYHVEIFRKILIGGTLTTILFATIWENMPNNNEFTMMLLLTIEAILFIFAGKSTKEKVFEIFGKIALGLSAMLVFGSRQISTTEVFQMFIIVPLLIAGFLYSAIPNNQNKPSNFSKVWGLISIFTTSILIIKWSFESNFTLILAPQWMFLSLIIPGLWAIGLAYSVTKTKQSISGIAALIFLIFFGAYGESLFKKHFNTPNISREFINFISYIILLTVHFGVLSSFFIKIKDFEYSNKLKKIAIISILTITSFYSIDFIRANFNDPIETLLVILWSSILLGLGYKNNWRFFRYFGIGMFLFIIAQIYLDKVWSWETPTRVLAFSILGLSLLGVSFFYQKQSSKKLAKK
jgi:hypothetical protein